MSQQMSYHPISLSFNSQQTHFRKIREWHSRNDTFSETHHFKYHLCYSVPFLSHHLPSAVYLSLLLPSLSRLGRFSLFLFDSLSLSDRFYSLSPCPFLSSICRLQSSSTIIDKVIKNQLITRFIFYGDHKVLTSFIIFNI